MRCRNADPSVAITGQVGSQVKIKRGNSWLLASVRTLQAPAMPAILANIDFIGEGTRKLTGRMSGFRRGVTRYPIPGAMVFPATTADLRRSTPPAKPNPGRHRLSDQRHPRGLYVDPMLGKHFALLGSTGTGKSTSAALILHRICSQRPRATS